MEKKTMIQTMKIQARSIMISMIKTKVAFTSLRDQKSIKMNRNLFNMKLPIK